MRAVCSGRLVAFEGALTKQICLQMTELSMPLHTLIELEPRPDGTMAERRFKVNIDSTCDDDVRACLLTAVNVCLCWMQMPSAARRQTRVSQ